MAAASVLWPRQAGRERRWRPRSPRTGRGPGEWFPSGDRRRLSPARGRIARPCPATIRWRESARRTGCAAVRNLPNRSSLWAWSGYCSCGCWLSGVGSRREPARFLVFPSTPDSRKTTPRKAIVIKQDDELDRLEEDIRKIKNKYDQFF